MPNSVASGASALAGALMGFALILTAGILDLQTTSIAPGIVGWIETGSKVGLVRAVLVVAAVAVFTVKEPKKAAAVPLVTRSRGRARRSG